MKFKKKICLTLFFLTVISLSFSQNKKSSGNKIAKPTLKSYSSYEKQTLERKDSLNVLRKSNANPELKTSSVISKNLKNDKTEDTLKNKNAELKLIGAYNTDEQN